MPKTGDYYTVSLKEAHMDWGGHRYTNPQKIRRNVWYT